MDFEFFQSLSPQQGEQFVERYLTVECEGFRELIPAMVADGINVDFTVASVSEIFEWILVRLRTEEVLPDQNLEWWIRESDSYKQSLVEFDDPSAILVLRCSYYLGESFVRQFDLLSWALGDEETLLANMPVVKGFRHDLEMPSILVTENLFHRALAHENGAKKIEEGIQAWLKRSPA